MNDNLLGKELFIRFSASAFRKLPSIYVFSYFPFGFEGRMWDLIVSVPEYCLSFYLFFTGLYIVDAFRIAGQFPAYFWSRACLLIPNLSGITILRPFRSLIV